MTIGTASVVAALCAATVTVVGGGDRGAAPVAAPSAVVSAAALPPPALVPTGASPSAAPEEPSPPAAATDADTAPVTLVAGTRTVPVADDDALTAALEAAAPGDVIELAPGTYAPIAISRSGSAEAPITLSGPADAVITGQDSGYVVHLEGASHWQLTGFSVSGGAKGVVVDSGDRVVLDRLTVGKTGEEAVHFRTSSSHNVIQHSTVHDTGLKKPQFGEGVYIGSAKSNWSKYGTGGGPDLSMHNRVLDTTFERITAENVDVKEETEGAVLARNRFDGSTISGENFADSVVDMKGFAATVVDNVTTGSSAALKNIIETHVITEPATSGCGNTFANNVVEGFEPAGLLLAIDKKCE